MGPAISPLAYLLKVLPLLVRWTRGRPHRQAALPLGREALIRRVDASVFPRPNLLANLVDRAEVRVVHQLHEVPVPELLIGHGGAAAAAAAGV